MNLQLSKSNQYGLAFLSFALLSVLIYLVYSQAALRQAKQDEIERYLNSDTEQQILKTGFARGYFVKYNNSTLILNAEKFNDRADFIELKFAFDSESEISCWPEFVVTSNTNKKIRLQDSLMQTSGTLNWPGERLISLDQFQELAKNFSGSQYLMLLSRGNIDFTGTTMVKKLVVLGCNNE